MNQKIQALVENIKSLQAQLSKEYENLAVQYQYSFLKRKVIFLEQVRTRHRLIKSNILRYLLSAEIRHIISAPFIYAMIVPAIVLDIFLYIYQRTAFRLYRIDIVPRDQYIVFDRHYLSYLNSIEKLNCIYCTYVNGLFAYAVEIGGRTEKYWCPIKAARNPRFNTHNHYGDFADYGNPEEFKSLMEKNHK